MSANVGKVFNLIGGGSSAPAAHTHTVSEITDFPSIPSTAADVDAVPTTRKINNKALSADISLSASDVGAAESSHTHTKSEITDFPTSMTPTSHTHGNITNAGAIGTTSGNSVYTTTNGVLTSGSLATTDPTASGTSTSFISTISQDAKGKITPAKASLPTASSSVAGITTVGASGGAAAYSHGNHVPTKQTADNATFLRNDNTWQKVTPANIGAAASSHNHGAGNITSGTLAVARGGTGAATTSPYYVFAGPSSGTAAAAPSFRKLVAADIPSLAASKIAAGTFAATGVVAATGTDYTTARVRNIQASTTDLTAGTSSLSNGNIYVVYE